MFNYYQKLTAVKGKPIYQYTLVESPGPNTIPFGSFGWIVSAQTGIADTDGVLAGKNINVTGHSLGGHLAMIMARLDPEHVNEVNTYNAPGFDTGLIPFNDNTDLFFEKLANAQIDRIGSTTIDILNFPAGRFSNLINEQDIISDIGTAPGGQLTLFSESSNINKLAAHSISDFTDVLAVYDLLGSIDESLTIEQITPMLEAGTYSASESLETIVSGIYELMVTGTTTPLVANDRVSLYQYIKEIKLSAAYENFKGNAVILDLSAYTSSDIITANALGTQNGIAYRYALVNMNPFVILGDNSIYDSHNTNGELDLYDPASQTGDLSEAQISDRAYFLSRVLEQNQLDRSKLTDNGESEYFRDFKNDIVAYTSDVNIPTFSSGLYPSAGNVNCYAINA